MSSRYKLFAVGLGEGRNRDVVTWVEPYEFFTRGVMGTTVSVPVYDKSVTPHLLFGSESNNDCDVSNLTSIQHRLNSFLIVTVAAIDSYMAVFDHILGEDAMSWLKEWIVRRQPTTNTEIALAKCQLDALLLLGGGERATCGICNSTSLVGVLPDKCHHDMVDLLNRIWDNTDQKSRTLFQHVTVLDRDNSVTLDTLYRCISGRENLHRACMPWN